MIQLPDNFMDMVMVLTRPDQTPQGLFLFLKNDADQYFTWWAPIDMAFPLKKAIDDFAAINTDGSVNSSRAFILESDMSTKSCDPVDQNWKPVPPFPPGAFMSLEQFKAMQGLA